MTLPDEALPNRMMTKPAMPTPARPKSRQHAKVAAATAKASNAHTPASAQ